MRTDTFDPAQPTSFIVRSPEAFRQKLARFAAAGPDSLYFLIDFDRTLTTSKHTGHNSTTWQILHDLLPEQGQAVSNQIREKYLALEATATLSAEESLDFTVSVLELHAAHKTSRHAIEQVARTVSLRDGSQQLFEACEAHAIPTVVLSAGISDIIEHIISNHQIAPTKVVSTKLAFDANGHVTGWQEDTLVLTGQKSEHVARVLPHIGPERPLTVVLGDTISDAHIVTGTDDVLRIRIADLKGQAASPTYQQESFAAGYDAIIEEDLSPLAALVDWLATHAAVPS